MSLRKHNEFLIETTQKYLIRLNLSGKFFHVVFNIKEIKLLDGS